MTYQRGNHAVRSNRWRYIRYADGTEELYDHANDPDEVHNLAARAEYADTIRKLQQALPRQSARTASGLR